LAGLLGGSHFKEEREKLKDCWRIFLIDQFHDVLPGTSIGLTYVDTKDNEVRIKKELEQVIQLALSQLILKVFGKNMVGLRKIRPQFDEIEIQSSQGMVVFNQLDFERFESFSCKIGDQKLSGNAMIDGFGHTLIDQKFLMKSSEFLGSS